MGKKVRCFAGIEIPEKMNLLSGTKKILNKFVETNGQIQFTVDDSGSNLAAEQIEEIAGAVGLNLFRINNSPYDFVLLDLDSIPKVKVPGLTQKELDRLL